MVEADSDNVTTFLLELYRKASSLKTNELYEYFLDHAVKITKSTIGFFHFVSDDEKAIILTTWNKQALENCNADYATHYPIEKAGNWADCVRIRRPVIYNDFEESPNQKGLPEGHVKIERMLSFPLIENNQAIAIFGVGNKADPYTENDVVQLELVASELGKILRQRRTEKELARDITERKKAEEVCRRSERRIADILGSIDDYVYALDRNWNIVYISSKAANDLRFKAEELVGKNFWQTLPAFLGTVVETNFRMAMDKRAIRRFEWKTIFVQGCVELAVFPSAEGITVYGKDITERKEMEDELLETLKASQKRQAEISALLDASKAVLIHRDFSKAAKSIFDSCKNLLGATAGYVALLSKDGKENEVLFLDAGGLPCTVDPALPMPIRGLRAEAYSQGKAVYCNGFSNSEWRKLMPPGHVELKNVLFAPLTIDGKTIGVIGLANKYSGFTERDAQMASAFGEIASIALMNSQMLERLETDESLLKVHAEHLEQLVDERTKQLKDSERLAVIGATAGMVGHDIRNPLQAIVGDIFLAKNDISSCPDQTLKSAVQENLNEIEKNVEYINKIVADLQDFAKPLNPISMETELRHVISQVIANYRIPENIQATITIEKEAEKIIVDPAYLQRILSNLINNAVQAMPVGGKLTVQGYVEGKENVITVEDTGVGIPEQVRSKLFTPLFTTKSKGQGFGLPVVKRMTEALGGTVTFESQENKGTKFIVRLPKKQSGKRVSK